MDWDDLWLMLNIVIWFVTLLWYWRRYCYIGAGGFLIILFFVFSILSTLLYNDSFWGRGYENITLLPFLYLYVMIMISIYPILKWDKLDVQRIGPKNSSIILIISWLFVICSFARISSFSNLGGGLMMMIADSDAGQEVYNEMTVDSQASLGDGSISNLFAILSNLLFDFGVLFLFYFLIKKEKYLFTIICLLISCFICVIIPIASSQRGPVLERILIMAIVYFAFSKQLSSQIKKIIHKVAFILLVLISIPIAYITISRFESRGILGSLYAYFGQQNLNFNMYAFDNNGIRYGDRIFPVFKKMLLFDNVPSNFWERRLKYPNLHINDEVFIGYVGDFLLDFGPFLSILIFITYSLFVYSRLNVYNGHIYIYKLLPLLMLMHICVYGSLFLFPLADMMNYQIILYILLYLFFKRFKI